jgi:membrane fusion protein (multidrug efflux system)
MKAKFLVVPLLLCLAVAGGVWWTRVAHHPGAAHDAAAAGEPPATVSAVRAGMQTWQERLSATGDVRAVQGSDLSAEVSGIVATISFTSGQDVAAGVVLLSLRPNDDEARLAQQQAAADLASANMARDRRQFDAQAISRATLDADESNLRADQAQVAAMRAQMAEKIVRAPFAGRLGIRSVDVGQYLTAGTAIVTLQALDPIYVDFNIQQQALSRIAPGQNARIHVDAWPDRVFGATITSINSRVDTASRMVMVRAELANHDHALLPGMFATVEIDAGVPMQRLTLPQSAISYNPYGNFVYVVAPGPGGLVAQSRVVETGAVRGDQVSILSGVAPGEQVVTAGQLKLRNGAPVVIDNTVRTSDDPAPAPQDE